MQRKDTKPYLRRILIGTGCSLLLLASTPLSAKSGNGYLKEGSFDILKVLPAAPTVGDTRYENDRHVFRTTRKLIGTPRWEQATRDVETGTADMMANFSCAAGINLTPQNAPKLTALIEKAGRDTGHNTGVAKKYYQRLRPFQIDDGKTCQPKIELAGSYDYPSGHTTWGWTWALILSELLPDRADAILARGRTYGESRIVCGVHNASAVEAGFLSATATIQAVRTTPAYAADLVEAQRELNNLKAKATTPAPASCAIEDKILSQNIFKTHSTHTGTP